jgi:hypothetical protein
MTGAHPVMEAPVLYQRRKSRRPRRVRRLRSPSSHPQMEFDDPMFYPVDAMPDIEDHEEWAYGLGCDQ